MMTGTLAKPDLEGPSKLDCVLSTCQKCLSDVIHFQPVNLWEVGL